MFYFIDNKKTDKKMLWEFLVIRNYYNCQLRQIKKLKNKNDSLKTRNYLIV